MKRISALLLVCGFLILTSFNKKFSISTNPGVTDDIEDFTYLEFPIDSPQPDIWYSGVFDHSTNTYKTGVIICPESGAPCNVKVTTPAGTFEVHDQKGRNRGSVEILN